MNHKASGSPPSESVIRNRHALCNAYSTKLVKTVFVASAVVKRKTSHHANSGSSRAYLY
jgi:hypothetical protein